MAQVLPSPIKVFLLVSGTLKDSLRKYEKSPLRLKMASKDALGVRRRSFYSLGPLESGPGLKILSCTV